LSETITCELCGKQKQKPPSHIADWNKHYCSFDCFINDKKNQRKGEYLECGYCGKPTYRRPSRVNRREITFCSKECYYKYRKENPIKPRNGKYLKCEYCGKKIYRSKTFLNKNEHHFCSNKCKGLYYSELDPEFFKEIRMKARGKYPKANTSIELKLQRILKSEKITFKTDKPILNMTKVDVFIEPNICIYADGDYWHSLSEVQERDQRINKELIKYGYKVLRFKGSEIRSNIGKCLRIIKKNIKKGERSPHQTNDSQNDRSYDNYKYNGPHIK